MRLSMDVGRCDMGWCCRQINSFLKSWLCTNVSLHNRVSSVGGWNPSLAFCFAFDGFMTWRWI